MRSRKCRQISEDASSEWLDMTREISMKHTPVSLFSSCRSRFHVWKKCSECRCRIVGKFATALIRKLGGGICGCHAKLPFCPSDQIILWRALPQCSKKISISARHVKPVLCDNESSHPLRRVFDVVVLVSLESLERSEVVGAE